MKSNLMRCLASFLRIGVLSLWAVAQEPAKSDSSGEATGAEIERVEHPVLRFTAPLWGGHHGTVWIWGKRGETARCEFALTGMTTGGLQVRLDETQVWSQSLLVGHRPPFDTWTWFFSERIE